MANRSRRQFISGMAAALLPAVVPATPVEAQSGSGLGFPLVDYHVHLNQSFTLENAIALSQKSGVKFGIVEHAGSKENLYAAILTDDKALEGWIARLEGKPVYKGVQAEWLDWTKCFSKQVVARLDYVLSDAMAIPGRGGEHVKMWLAGFDPGDPREFMDRYVKWNVEVIEKEPLDILAHPTWLPSPLDKDYDLLWTEERMKPIIAALRRTGTAVEIDAAYSIPRAPFLRMAKQAKLKFACGSNSGTGPARAIDFCTETAKALGLKAADMFLPASRARKPINRRKIAG